VTLDETLDRLRSLGSPRNVKGMARFGIRSAKVYGVATPDLRRLARQIGRDHRLATRLWVTGIHDARVLASMVEDPEKVTARQMDRWARDFDSWAVCDACCCHLFPRTPFAWSKGVAWSTRPEEYVKRAGFALMAYLAVHDKDATDADFKALLPILRREAGDPRNFVKKAVNWALRQIGKRNAALNAAAIRTAQELRRLDAPSARWIAADALRELESAAVQARLRKNEAK
jgi:3-methyladenine DNA glycosylase AlkD